MGATVIRPTPLPARAGLAAFALLSDERLAQLARASPDRAFAVIYQRYHQPLYRYCRSILHDDAEAEDALQSTLANALAALQRGRRDAPLRPWLFRIAHNESVSVIRRRTVPVPAGAAEPAFPSAAEQAQQHERIDSLFADLLELPERQRGALVMRELSGLSHREIAVALGMTVAAAKQAVFEARGSLAEFQEGRAMACEQVRRAISDGDGRALRGRRIRAHVRACAGCKAFADAIPERRAQLQALVPPLAAPAAAGVLAQVMGGSGHGSGAGGMAAGLAGKGAGVATSIAAKGAVGVVVLATAAGGVTGAIQLAGSAGSSGHPGASAGHSAASLSLDGSAATPSATAPGGVLEAAARRAAALRASKARAGRGKAGGNSGRHLASLPHGARRGGLGTLHRHTPAAPASHANGIRAHGEGRAGSSLRASEHTQAHSETPLAAGHGSAEVPAGKTPVPHGQQQGVVTIEQTPAPEHGHLRESAE